ncbi:MAG: phosphoribosylanthranilate isomerase [Bryobacteraceae bacterium]|nr:phosphoribosylanthranilate isomerase [Bryobacteraceae bacterium]
MNVIPINVIKVCGVTTAEDAAVAVDAGATAIGFNFARRSPRYVDPQAWMSQVPVLKVGVFVGDALDLPWLDVAQIHGEGSAYGVAVWRAVKPGQPMRNADAYVLDPSEGTGATFDWALAAGLPEKIVLAGGLDASNVAQAIRAAKPWGVDACSKLESSPGHKDPVKVREFVAAAREAFQC